MIALRERNVTYPKFGNLSHENEDAYASQGVAGERAGRSVSVRYVLSDGASESSFAREWATLLVETIAQEVKEPLDIAGCVARAGQQLAAGVDIENLPWYAEEKVRRGAFATLLVASVDCATSVLEATSVGDTSVFVVRDDALVLRFPFLSAAEFNNRPPLVSSNAAHAAKLIELTKTVTFPLLKGDVLFLCTDALAQWFLTSVENGHRPWRDWNRRIRNSSRFLRWLNRERTRKLVNNDDSTLVVISVT